MDTPHHQLSADTIARGGGAQVMEATHKSTGRKRVAKVLDLQDPERGSTNLVAFYNETQLLRRFQECHNFHIIRLHESYILKEHGILVLERMDYDLLELILKGTLTLAQKLTIFRDICLAAQYCHDSNVAHLDLKPDNVLLRLREDGQFSVRLADFGGSQEMYEGLVEDVTGTLFYNAPEIILQKDSINGVSADVWSLGVTLHVLLSGTWPFRSDDPETIRSLLGNGRIDIHSSVSKTHADFLSRILQSDPTQRISIFQILNSELMRPYCTPDQLAMIRRRTKVSLPRRLMHWLHSPRATS